MKAPDWWVKIADFGISKRRQQGVTTAHTFQPGTINYSAPEALGIGEGRNETYTFAVDMWSLGAVVFRMLTSKSVFHNLGELFDYVTGNLDFPVSDLQAQGVSSQCQEFVEELMSPSPKARKSSAAALSHAWITTQLVTNPEASLVR